MNYNLIIIGGGAAGVFTAIKALEESPNIKVLLLEKGSQLLTKVRISGGGRCNVTHSCFEPKELVKRYPRGEKELVGPFHRFQPKDIIHWLEERGVPLKTEEDGRVFPTTDSSATIIDCFLGELKKRSCEIRYSSQVRKIEKGFQITLDSGETLRSDALLLATGSAKQGYDLAASLGHTIIPPVPSLFTFNLPTSPLLDLAGIVTSNVELNVGEYRTTGPLLLTHWGFSGPAALKLSAFAARILAEKNYHTTLTVNWVNSPYETVLKELYMKKETSPAQTLSSLLFYLPKNLWKRLLIKFGLDPEKKLADLSKASLQHLAKNLTQDSYQMDGKSTYKEEFVTAGGINKKEIHFQTMESKLCPGLYFAGEIVDIDGITGGYNFQNAWTGAYLAAKAISSTTALKHKA
ncbi:MAG TPA: NAD(P)/FAD-dependent oxidoreductase [Chlamydiales bacterium]|nr:NAD(P)/FAD-dependent oxidoreductase [Chlamydiales bacterium]